MMTPSTASAQGSRGDQDAAPTTIKKFNEQTVFVESYRSHIAKNNVIHSSGNNMSSATQTKPAGRHNDCSSNSSQRENGDGKIIRTSPIIARLFGQRSALRSDNNHCPRATTTTKHCSPLGTVHPAALHPGTCRKSLKNLLPEKPTNNGKHIAEEAHDDDQYNNSDTNGNVVASSTKTRAGSIVSLTLARFNRRQSTRSNNNNSLQIQLLESRIEQLEGEAKELNDKHAKAMKLLTSMLPPTVCDSLLSGSALPPESYELVTIYFSDIVGFTTISSESTPLEVVNMLNALYTRFDDRIDIYDVYKVETIGDAYMLVSGCPRRNGIRHVGEIATLALDLQWMISDFRIPHMPDTKLQLRIGFHSGPAMAAIVGHKMPRYCLFGDTVNVASRMESTGKEFKIHLSLAAKELLDEVGGFETELRGDIEVKGKNLMTTYWLVGKEGFEFRIEKDVCEFIPKKRKRGRSGSAAAPSLQSEGGVIQVSSLANVTENAASSEF